MSFLSSYILGVRVYIWLPFLMSILVFLSCLYFFLQNKIKGFFYNTFKKEKTIKIVIIYPTACYTFHWELLPKENQYKIDGKRYIHDDKAIIRSKFGFVNEMHFFYNCPQPIIYESKTQKLKFNSEQLELMKENDLFVKLLSLQTERNMMMLLMILIIINSVISVIIVLKQFGVFDK